MEHDPILPGRKCGRCTLCCKVPPIDDLNKPHDVWCQDCDIGRGCRIYDRRPPVCREFYCGYLTSKMIGEHWFPARSKMIPVFESGGDRLTIYVDSSRPNAWREQPYYGEIKHWATLAARELKPVIIYVAGRSIVVLPDEDVDLGHVAKDERINLREVLEEGRRRLRATKIRADDPRLAGVRMGEVTTYKPHDSLWTDEAN